MKLNAFKIKNYRSIVDSGWKNLANDNITALIGQNESGKTTVLEALMSFYDSKINEDILRSDLTFPEVSCLFHLEDKTLISLVDKNKLPKDLIKYCEECNELRLTRKWQNETMSKIYVSNEDIENYYKKLEDKKIDVLEKTQDQIEKLLKEAEHSFSDIEFLEKHNAELQTDLVKKRKIFEEAKKVLGKKKRSDEKIIAQQNFDSAQKAYSEQEKEFKKSIQNLEERKNTAQQISEKVSVCKLYGQARESLDMNRKLMNELRLNLANTKHLLEISSSDKDRKQYNATIEKLVQEIKKIEIKCLNMEEEVEINQLIASYVISGSKYREAQLNAKNEYNERKEKYNLNTLGSHLFQYLPVFEFFEDFSSLLPNRIDLEDVLNENSSAEGYKAAKNFLIIAGLSAEFFREKNQRILKQKIENLNSDITINFQDYWSQDVGKNNKIRLNFELEHYDYTVPEKSGKPYVEFWIKDKQERLYPKQRSRGVRWFLSFYLELKATAKQNNINRVLLIDEPGLSLHARAQEDVLKVFEDLKDDMQIIYCTHSPHLVDVNKLYRIIAVQRADEDDENSETVVLDSKSLHSASSDTLTPIYSLMGIRLHDQQFIHPNNNIIVEDTITYYYVSTIARMLQISDIYFLPSSGMSSIPYLANILMGWKLEYYMFLFDNKEAHDIIEELNNTIFIGANQKIEKSLVLIKGIEAVEDLFSTIDFKNYILQERVGITDKNSEFIKTKGLSRTILASNFINSMEEKKMQFDKFDNETKQNFKKVFDQLRQMLKEI